MTKVTIGQAAPDVLLKTIDGQAIALAETWQGNQHTLLIFLRHLA
jgi:hypothetical protein